LVPGRVGAGGQRHRSLPSGWADTDIGSPGLPGAADYSVSSGTWSVAGGGSDIWNTSDQFHFASEHLAGDGSIVARVTSVQNTDPWAKAGVMFRDSADPSAPFVDVVATPGQGVSFQWRSAAGGNPSFVAIPGVTAPVWVRLVRSGNAFSGYYSTDGVTWTQIGTTQTIAMSTTALAGLAVTAHNNALLNTATFANVSLTTPLNGGGFETPNVGTGTYGAFQYDPSGSPWTFADQAGVAGNGSGFTAGNPDAPEGTQVAFLQGAGASISQSLTFASGTYSLSFLAAQRGNYQYSSRLTSRFSA
jgi:hypothetical protein